MNEKAATNIRQEVERQLRSKKAASIEGMADVFNPEEAIRRCFDSKAMVRGMIQGFFEEVDALFPQMRAALEKGDLLEVGQLGHRVKGTVAYLGADLATQAARRVERSHLSSGVTASEAEEAINALEHECLMLKSALSKHPLAQTTT